MRQFISTDNALPTALISITGQINKTLIWFERCSGSCRPIQAFNLTFKKHLMMTTYRKYDVNFLFKILHVRERMGCVEINYKYSLHFLFKPIC